jgi:hypothetical protein
MAIFPGSAIPAGGEYTIDQSLRFEDGSTAYLSRTPASAGNRRTWTWSAWVKMGQSDIPALFGAFQSGGGPNTSIYTSGDQFKVRSYDGSTLMEIYTEAVLRDYSAWYHLMVSMDTTQASTNDRVKMYINGEEQVVTRYISPSQNYETYINSTNQHDIGRYAGYASYLFHGYQSEVHFIDGQALTPDYFGEVDATYGHWKPIRYTGTYGTNGFYLPFSGTFYNDASGNGNNWTANNLATTDVVLDSPTNNFCTWNPLAVGAGGQTYSEGNLKLTTAATAAWHGGVSNIGMTSGKWYAEFIYTASVVNPTIGVPMTQTPRHPGTSAYGGAESDTGIGFAEDGTIYTQGSATNKTNSGFAVGDVIGIALDVDNRTVDIYKNNVDIGGATSINVGTYYFGAGEYNATSFIANFGQDSSFAGNKTAQNNTDANGYGDFYYPVPSGFLSLCSANLSEPAVVPAEHFNTVLYAGNSSTQSITGAGFQPDLTWLKSRSFGYNHYLYDSIRGATKALQSNSTNAEETRSGLTSFTADGFNLGSALGDNDGSYTYVSWNWKANNTSGSSNTDGSITSTVAANVDAGFSIVAWTGTGSAGTIGHGLSQAPEMVIQKGRSYADQWHVLHASTAVTSGAFLRLSATEPVATNTNIWSSTLPTSSVFSVGADGGVNPSGGSTIAYCFHSVDGYSKFGSYTGNGSTDGPFVYTGFRPAFVIWKNASASTDWHLRDTKMSPYNVSDEGLFPNGSYAESTDSSYAVDILSNGFKPRNGTYAWNNASGATYIYMAFAEFPTKFANAR